ncbi:MAG: type III-B CRISPR module RAMP protein Cmr1 [Pseudomonadota bacterium]
MNFYIERFKDIETKEFEVEVVTPFFLGGADRNKAELRVPSIKGALRFWWRAIYAHLSLDKLREKEAEIFGDAGDRSGKSKIRIKIDNALSYNGRDRENPVPHKKVSFAFPCFNPGEKFSLRIYGNEKSFELFKLVSILGGLGKRSRRGFGSFKINKIDGQKFGPISSIKEIRILLESISQNKFKIEREKIIRTGEVHSQADYAYIRSIEVGSELYDSYKEILKMIGQSSHDNKSDYTGYARRQERFSSPIYVSVVKTGDKYRPIITTLNMAFKNRNENHGNDKSSSFKNDILSGGLR